uniref:Uncharacterized protein n=1 Tax=Romanomermis culicivorax TaxID=13658 RepID=A0A915HP46_ROMCU
MLYLVSIIPGGTICDLFSSFEKSFNDIVLHGHKVVERSPVVGHNGEGIKHYGMASQESKLDEPCNVSHILVLDIQLCLFVNI